MTLVAATTPTMRVPKATKPEAELRAGRAAPPHHEDPRQAGPATAAAQPATEPAPSSTSSVGAVSRNRIVAVPETPRRRDVGNRVVRPATSGVLGTPPEYDLPVTDENRVLQAAMREAHELGFFEDQDGHDFQPEELFESSAETTEWWHAWTGNPASGPAPFRVFGHDGSGGAVAFWARASGEPIENQAIVFLGSEGELCVISRNLNDYLWLLAHGAGPLEVVDGIHRTPEQVPALVALAHRHLVPSS